MSRYEDYDDVFDDFEFSVQPARPAPPPQQKQEQSQAKPKEVKTKKKVETEMKTVVQKKEEFFMRPPLSDFQLNSQLQKLCAEADEGEELKTLHLVVLGHVDAGKSTLMGRLMHDLGHVSQKTMHKYQKEATQAGKASFSWAWVLDERPEERARGVTIDIATTHFQTKKFNITLLDAPGHKDFVPNMISGAAQADAALLVVDGSIGGFEAGFEIHGHEQYYGQTREHGQLARSLGIEQVAVIVSKLDSCDYAKCRFEFIQSEMTPFLLQCGFRKTSIQWLIAAAPHGVNLIKAPAHEEPLLKWYQGPTVLDAIDAFHPITRNNNSPLRLPVNEVLKTRTLGHGVSGKIESGATRVGSKIWVLPIAEAATVKAIEIGGKSVEFAKAGDSCDIGLTGVDENLLFSGCVLCTEGWPVPVSKTFECKVVILDVPKPILPGLQVSLQCHTARESAKISRLVALLNPKTYEITKEKPRCLLKGQTAVIEVESTRNVCLEEYGACRSLGRVTLRESGHTIAVGITTKIIG